jgi:hypothetical protein
MTVALNIFAVIQHVVLQRNPTQSGPPLEFSQHFPSAREYNMNTLTYPWRIYIRILCIIEEKFKKFTLGGRRDRTAVIPS